MATRDPTDKNLLRMELRRFQSRCEAQEGSIKRADSLHEVVRLAGVSMPYRLTEDVAALDARRQLKRTAENRARDLFEESLAQLMKAEPFVRGKLHQRIGEDILQFSGELSQLRSWAYARLATVEQSLTAGG